MPQTETSNAAMPTNSADPTSAQTELGNSDDRIVLSATCQIPGLLSLYQQYLGNMATGTFVEVGAYDGEYVSNTSGLADAGWTGLYVEPVPQFADQCQARHAGNPGVSVHKWAIGADAREGVVHLGGPLSTMDPEIVKLFSTLPWAADYHNGETIDVKQITLDQFLSSANLTPGFELLIVDVEGYEWNVFRGFDIARWSPQMVIVELHDENDEYLPIRDRCKRIASYFQEHHYSAVYKDSTNTVYVSPQMANSVSSLACNESAKH